MPQNVAIQSWTGKCLLPLHNNTPDATQEIRIKLPAGTYPLGQILEETATPGTYQAVTAAANAKLILKYPIFVDAAGNHFKGDGAGAVEDADISATAYKGGEFDTRDLRGIGGTALANDAPGNNTLNQLGRLIQGNAGGGIVRLI